MEWQSLTLWTQSVETEAQFVGGSPRGKGVWAVKEAQTLLQLHRLCVFGRAV